MSNIFKTGIKIPRVVKKLELANYHKELKGAFIMVWVNLTRAAHQEYADIQEQLRLWSNESKEIVSYMGEKVTEAQEAKKSEKEIEKIRTKLNKDFEVHMEEVEAINEEMYAWYAQIWSQHENEVHHCIATEVKAIAETSMKDDNGNFWSWITTRTHAMIIQHGNQHLKK